MAFFATSLVGALLATSSSALAQPAILGSADDGNSGSSPLAVTLGADFGIFNNVPDLRYKREVINDIFGNRKEVPDQRYRVFTQNFHLNFLLQKDEGYNSGLQLWLGFRNAFGGDESSPAGSELSGFRMLFRQSFFGGYLLNSLGYGLMRSDFLKLIAQHNEFRIRFDYVPNPLAQDPTVSPFFIKIGPEIVTAQTTENSPADSYGFQWGINLLLRYQTLPIPKLPLSFGLETLFRRIDRFEILNERFGGAGLLTLSPQIEWMLVENLWLGMKIHLPVLRPEGREEAFSDPELVGLYGSSFQFTLRTATF